MDPWAESLLDALEDMRQQSHPPIRMSGHVIILPPNRPRYKWKRTLRDGEIYFDEVEE